MRQHHYVGTVKHVGIVRTSKSQQYAFEVVVKDDIVLFFGCENQILREEWIAAFVDVMNTVGEINKDSPPSMSNVSPSHATVERKGSLNGKSLFGYFGKLSYSSLIKCFQKSCANLRSMKRLMKEFRMVVDTLPDKEKWAQSNEVFDALKTRKLYEIFRTKYFKC